MQQQDQTIKYRIDSIDILRGIAMIIMALDHVRDYFHISANTQNPLDLNTTTPALFFTRWITHFCAPTFVFLSGTSIYLQSLRKTKSELSVFLIKRGLWLIVAEFCIISLGWTFNPFYNIIIFQVIGAIGISMIIIGTLIRLPFKLIFYLGLFIVLAHNLLDIPESDPDFKAGFLWDLLHHGFFTTYPYAPGHILIIVYPFIAWTGLMMLGYCTGVFFTNQYSATQRKKIFIQLGVGLIALFIVLRFAGIYGDPIKWNIHENIPDSIFAFVDVHKYPPSLEFMLMTIGPVFLMLSLLENISNSSTAFFRIYGRVAFFYYILHIYLIHIIATFCFFMNGHTFKEAIPKDIPFLFVIPGEGFNLPIVYAIWLFVVISLYPLCKWYDQYKTQHKEKWWLSYL